MKIKYTKTGKTADVNGSYAARLHEQGRAVYLKPEPHSQPQSQTQQNKPGKGK